MYFGAFRGHQMSDQSEFEREVFLSHSNADKDVVRVSKFEKAEGGRLKNELTWRQEIHP